VDLHPDAWAGLAEAQVVLEELLGLCAGWDSYCVSRLVWNLSALEWAQDIEPLDLGYIGSNVVALRKVLTDLLPSYRRDAAPALTSGRRDVEPVLNALSELLVRFRLAMRTQFALDPELLLVDWRHLLAGSAG
jgi:hypothetical protein